ncbi:alpha/beta hydrolase family protein [Halalkalicoccus subterraneus]|uniref:alpha/beta hydrolase family protein n=1 Tax=Halalkalicoccus subterraneus TaxID=2675002 RepID=UPI000EFA98B6|nr:prolyl oligopeptidase family serine peptidase [Halalkalicoccus subterraneus]
MDGFRANLDGYYDVGDQLPRHLRERAETRFEATRERKDAIRSVTDHERRVERVRAAFLDALGGLPDERTPLCAECTGRVRQEGYSVEKVVYESLPGMHVTGSLYRPDGDGPFPAVLFLCGHAATGKASPAYQRACIELARNGFVAFAIDPIGQGERIQSYDPETGEIARMNLREHTYLGQQCQVAGSNLARYFVWDMVRALDYLEGRSDVDEDRLGATGNSGGGMQTGFLLLADDRLDAAVPCCFVTSREEYMKTGQAQDGEQILFGAIERGIDYDDFIAAFAPKPVLIGSAQSDFLCIEGSRKTLRRARDVYELYDRPENVDLAVADDTHGLSAPLREAMINWFRKHLRGVAPTFETEEPPVEDEATLLCTEVGQVHGEYEDETHVVECNREFVHERYDNAGSAPAVDDRDAYAESIRETVIERFGLARPASEPHPRRIEAEIDEVAGVRWEKVFFYAEPDVLVAGIVAVALEPPERTVPTLVLSDHGTEEFEAFEERIAAHARERGIAMAFDPRGVGAVRSRAVNTLLANGGEYFDYHGTEYKLTSDALMLGTSLFGMRVFDVLRARTYLERRVQDHDDLDRVDGYALDGTGVGSLHALVAAAADPQFRRIHAADVPAGFYEIATATEYEIDFRLVVHGIVGECDVPQLLPALEERDLTWERTDPSRFR